METDYNSLMEIVRKGKDQFLKYAVIHKIMDNALVHLNYPSIDKNEFKEILSEEEIDFFNEYFPTLFKLTTNATKLNDNQRKELSDLMDNLTNTYQRLGL
jgi:hypothetical protein